MNPTIIFKKGDSIVVTQEFPGPAKSKLQVGRKFTAAEDVEASDYVKVELSDGWPDSSGDGKTYWHIPLSCVGYSSPDAPVPAAATVRKQTPVATGVIDYFPDAMLAIARLSFVGNEQHNPGTALHWDRAKSGDESDALMRHFIQRGTVDNDGIRHTTKVAWRALALLQKELEKAGETLS